MNVRHAIVTILVVLIGHTARAGAAPPAQQCTAKKVIASGKFAACRLKAEGVFIRTGDGAKLAAALVGCSDKLNKAFQKADQKFGTECLAVEPVAEFETFLSRCADETVAAGTGIPFASSCGDGVIDAESCDGADLGGQSCASLGLGTGTLGCSFGCGFDTSGCVPPFCGDGVVNASGEQCDGSDLAGQSCSSFGFSGGTLGCAVDCTINTAACTNLRCCQIIIGGSINACLDVVDVTHCSAFTLPGVSATATVAPFGQACEGATGLCATAPTGPGTCCQIDGAGVHTCAEGYDPTGSTCDLVEVFALALVSMPFFGQTCVSDPAGGYACQP